MKPAEGVRDPVRRIAGRRARRAASARSPLSHSRTLALSHCRKGAVLLEAIAALVILAVAGTAAVTMVSQSAHTVRIAREADVEAREANAFFSAVSLWTREDLDRRLGERPQGDWRLIIQRPTPTLYEVVLVDSTSSREILRTSLYRPEAPKSVLPPLETPDGMPGAMPGTTP